MILELRDNTLIDVDSISYVNKAQRAIVVDGEWVTIPYKTDIDVIFNAVRWLRNGGIYNDKLKKI